MVEQQAAGAVVWTKCSQSLEDLWAAKIVDVPPGIDGFPLLQRGRGDMTEFDEEDCDYLMESASRSLEFHQWAFLT